MVEVFSGTGDRPEACDFFTVVAGWPDKAGVERRARHRCSVVAERPAPDSSVP